MFNRRKKLASGKRRRGYTLVELMACLSILAFASTAVEYLMYATFRTKSHVIGMVDGSAQAETALRRMIEVTRSSQDIIYTDPVSGLWVETVPDSTDTSFIYIYYVSNSQLREKIESSTGGSGGSIVVLQDTVLVSNLTSFTVTRTNASFPPSYRVDLVVNGTPVPISRSVVITARNITH